jgi:hypothetical protein
MMVALADGDFFACISSFEFFQVKVQEALALINQHTSGSPRSNSRQ